MSSTRPPTGSGDDQAGSPRPPGAPGRLQRTPNRALVVAGVLGALAGWLLVTTSNALNVSPPLVTWLAPITLLVAALFMGGLAYALRQRIQVRRTWIDPQQAVVCLALAKAAALVGALVAGGYLAFGLMFLSRWEADAPRERVIRSAVAVVAGVALMITGLLAERACEVPDPDDSSEESAGPSDQAS